MYIDSFYYWSCGLPLRPTPCAMSFGFHGAEVCRLKFVLSKKATKIDKISPVDLTHTA